MIKAVIFDFDGVILESAHIKTAAFRELFSKWPEDKARAGLVHHLNNTGINRFVKFRYFYENILREEYTPEIEKQMGDEFERLVFQQVLAAPLVSGAAEFLENHSDKYKFFIASGTPDQELKTIVLEKKLDKYFTEVNGAPATKDRIIESILGTNGYERADVVFVGDGESDMKAAQKTGISFILRRTGENQNIVPLAGNVINDLNELDNYLKR